MKFGNIIIVVVTLLLSIYNVYHSNNGVGLSDIALANVEALADSEWVPGKGWTCYKYVEDNVYLENFSVVVFCGDCSSYSATVYHNSSYCTYSGMYD